MKNATLCQLTLLSFTGLLPLLGACSAGHHGQTYTIDTFVESEVNDVAPLADYFGVLRPGDHFFIDGHITDIPYDPRDPWNGYDPFDGFAFTAAQPIHVEFRLWIDNPYTDLDVIVYDPQIDQDVGWFQSANNPEIGAVEVYWADLDFHLVLESFVGSSGYSLEIEVYGLYLDEGGSEASNEIGPEPSENPTGIAADRVVDPDRAEVAEDALEGYRRGDELDGEAEEYVREAEIDPQTGEVRESSHALDADG